MNFGCKSVLMIANQTYWRDCKILVKTSLYCSDRTNYYQIQVSVAGDVPNLTPTCCLAGGLRLAPGSCCTPPGKVVKNSSIMDRWVCRASKVFALPGRVVPLAGTKIFQPRQKLLPLFGHPSFFSNSNYTSN